MNQIQTTAASLSTKREVVFILDNLPDVPTLVADVPAGTEVHVLRSDTNALEQMATILRGHSNLNVIHLLSHGSAGLLNLGALQLDSSNITDHADALAQVGAALSEDGDLLLYGCDVAQSAVGRDLVTEVARLTRADLAASTDRTGIGGNLQLEFATGVIESQPLTQAFANYGHALAIKPVNTSWDGLITGNTGNGIVAQGIVTSFNHLGTGWNIKATNNLNVNISIWGLDDQGDQSASASIDDDVLDFQAYDFSGKLSSVDFDSNDGTNFRLLSIKLRLDNNSDTWTSSDVTVTGYADRQLVAGATKTFYNLPAAIPQTATYNILNFSSNAVFSALSIDEFRISFSSSVNIVAVDDIVITNSAPGISSLNGDNPNFVVGSNTAVNLDSGTSVSVSDSDQTTFDKIGYVLVKQSSAGSIAVGKFSFDGTTVKAGADGTISVGERVTVSGTDIGSVTTISDASGTAGDRLKVTFDTNTTTPARVSTLLRNLLYTDTNLTTGGRDFDVTVFDGYDTSTTATVTITGNPPPVISSATYNATTGTLLVSGANMQAKASTNNDIVASKLTLTGEGGATYTLTDTPDVELSSAAEFTLTLSATDKAALNQIVNKNDTTSTGGTTYNLAAADDWNAGVISADTSDTTGNGVTASNVAAPTITSATYNASTGALVVTGTGFFKLNGVTNDIDVSKLTLLGEGNESRSLSAGSVEITSGTVFTVTLDAADQVAVGLFFNKNGLNATGGTTYNLAAAEDWAAGADPAVVVADLTGNGITVSNIPTPQITSATYNANTGALDVAGTGFVKLNGSSNDIDVSKITLLGEGNESRSLSSGSVEITSSTAFTVTLSTADQAAVGLFLNKNGTSATGGVTYNLIAAEDWAAGANPAVVVADLTSNGITVSNIPTPQISSATYNATTGALVVTGTSFVKLSGATNDINATKFSILAEGATLALTASSSVDITSGTSFTITLGAADKAALAMLTNQAGTQSINGVAYNLVAAEDWAAGAQSSVVVADLTGNGITVSNIPSPTITSATWTRSTGVLVITGTNFVSKTGAANDVDVTKLTLMGDATAYTLTADTTNVELTSATSISITLGAADKAALTSRLNKVGTSSIGNVAYNLQAAENWLAGSAGAVNLVDADLTGNVINAGGFPPVITSNGGGATASINVVENVSTVSTVTATDPDNNSVTFSITGGTDSGKFAINTTTGALTLVAAPNFEAPTDSDNNNIYVVDVTANDGQAGTAVQTITVNVTNRDEVAPTITSAASATAINENSGAGQLIYTATSTDTGDTATGATSYSLKAATGDGSAFSINATTGAVTLTGNPNFEAKSSYSFTVIATDAANNASEKAVTLAINNLDEVAPTITSAASATAINENSGAGQLIYTA
ncbi:MAG: DUF4347 domain-containing protein, partial [Rhodoferax sp.]|nr:DUF4347 domain-containing protein [Rhodoferax sp.]